MNGVDRLLRRNAPLTTKQSWHAAPTGSSPLAPAPAGAPQEMTAPSAQATLRSQPVISKTGGGFGGISLSDPGALLPDAVRKAPVAEAPPSQIELIGGQIRDGILTDVGPRAQTEQLSDPTVDLPEELQPRRSGSWYSVQGSTLPPELSPVEPVFPSQYARAGRTWGVPEGCRPNGDGGGSSSSHFVKLKVQTCSLLEFGGQARPAAVVQQYADLDAARQWFNYAYALATDDTIIAALDAVNPKTGRWDDNAGGDPEGIIAQVRYVRAIVEAIAAGYNAANIPWTNDPIARGLWRDWFAGQDSASDTAVSSDYNGSNFYRKDRDANRTNPNMVRPLLKARNSNAGAIPFALVEIVARVTPPEDRHPIIFYRSAGVMVVGITDNDGSPYYASRARNRSFATSALSNNRATGFWSSRHEVLDAPGLNRDNVREDRFAVRLANVERSPEYQDDWYANRSSTDRVRRDWGLSSGPEYADWRAFSYDTWTALQGEEEISAVAPLRWYVGWLREWTRSLTTTTPMGSDEPIAGVPVPAQRSPQTRNGIPRRDIARILADSLSWASDMNMRWVRALGDSAFNTALVASIEDQVNASVPEPNRTVTMIGEVVGGTTRLVADALLPGVGSAIGASISAITSLIARLIPESTRLRFGRDDLGRPKPSFERLSLDGSIRDGQVPTFERVPPGYCRRAGVSTDTTLSSPLCGVSAGGTGVGTGRTDGGLPGGSVPPPLPPLPPPPPKEDGTSAITVVGLVVLGSAFAFAMAKKKKKSSGDGYDGDSERRRAVE